jgi:hypothetical protein
MTIFLSLIISHMTIPKEISDLEIQETTEKERGGLLSRGSGNTRMTTISDLRAISSLERESFNPDPIDLIVMKTLSEMEVF